MKESEIDRKVLAAFQVEVRENLEKIRDLMTRIEPEANVAGDDNLQEIYRLVHSLKGGARVSALRPAEQLSHALETLLDRLNEGQIGLGPDVLVTVSTVLDVIEDWMAALDCGEPLPDVAPSIDAVERTLQASRPPNPDEFALRLRDVFRTEFAELIQSLGQFIQNDPSINSVEQVGEAVRIAHTLAGAARAAGYEAVGTVASSLEMELRPADSLDPSLVVHRIAETLPALEVAFQADEEQSGSAIGFVQRAEPDAPVEREMETIGQEMQPVRRDWPARSTPPPTIPTGSQETVRLSVESLDRLLQCSRELMVEGQRHAKLLQELEDIRRNIDDMERLRESASCLAVAEFHRLSASPGYERLFRHMESVDGRIRSAASQLRGFAQKYRQAEWILRVRSRELDRHVREVRMVPVEDVFHGIRKMVRDLARDEGKQIEFVTSGFDVRADRQVLQMLRDPIIHMLRNSISHGIETPEARARRGKPALGRVNLEIRVTGHRLQAILCDDGQGIDVDRIVETAVQHNVIGRSAVSQRSKEELAALIFAPGLSTSNSVTELAGRGMGLSIVSNAVSRLGGDVQLTPGKDAGTQFRISVPMSVCSQRVIVLSDGDQKFAVPLHGVVRLLQMNSKGCQTIEGRPVIMLHNQPIPLLPLASLLGRNGSPRTVAGNSPVIVIKSGARCLAVRVDAILEERDALVQELDTFAQSRLFVGAVLLDENSVALVISPAELLAARGSCQSQGSFDKVEPVPPPSSRRILVVDDSFTTRTLEKSILETHGYHVQVAVDGVEAMSQLRQEPSDLVITDIEMPRMDGFALLEAIKADQRLTRIPVILVTSRDQAADKRRGLDLGADAYIVKRKFDHQDLLKTIEQVI